MAIDMKALFLLLSFRFISSLLGAQLASCLMHSSIWGSHSVLLVSKDEDGISCACGQDVSLCHPRLFIHLPRMGPGSYSSNSQQCKPLLNQLSSGGQVRVQEDNDRGDDPLPLVHAFTGNHILLRPGVQEAGIPLQL